MKRVVITGIGAVTPLGSGFQKAWNAVVEGASGIGGISRFDTSSLPWKVAGEVNDFDATVFFSEKELRRLDLFAQYAVASSIMAAEDADLTDTDGRIKKQHSETGIIVGSSRGGIGTIEKALLHGSGISRRLSPYLMPSTTISMAASYAALRLGTSGYCLGISNACSSGANAIGEAYRLARSGYGSPILAGGADAPICRLSVEGYGAAGALSKNSTSVASRPFDIDRDGFVISEGACMLVIEELDNALKRGAHIYGEIAGYGNTVDSLHQTRPDPLGEAKAIKKALQDSNVGSEAVDYINTHGTSTIIGDAAESKAIEMVFGKRAETIPCSAIKSMTGHMIAASGAFEAACTAMTLRDGIMPPTINLHQKDPVCSLNIITRKSLLAPEIALTSSFGFGGVNAVLVLKKYI